MAVVRFKLDTAALNRTARDLKRVGLVRAPREFGRAAQRPGRTAELTGQELRRVLDVAGLLPRVRRTLEELLPQVEFLERYDLTRRERVQVRIQALHELVGAFAAVGQCPSCHEPLERPHRRGCLA
jgi:hypothetical protein